LAEHVPVYVLEPEHSEYHAPLDDDIQVEDQPYADDALLTADEEHEPEDDDDDDDIDDEDEEPTKDEEEEEHPARQTVCAESSATAATRTPRGQYDFVDNVEAGQGLIRSPGHDARTIARAADRAEDVGYSCGVPRQRAKDDVSQTNERTHDQRLELRLDTVVGHRIMPVTRQGANDAMTPESIQAMIDRAIQRNSTHTQDDASHNSGGGTQKDVPKTLDEAIELANDLMDQKLCTYAERQNDNKRKADDSSRNNQQPHKKKNIARAYTVGPGEKKAYTETLPLCTKCNYHHTGQCAPKCGNCKRYGHATNDCRVNTNNNKNQKAGSCYECGNTGHIKKNCPK
ncbi:putative reverse transcriptase domain-containing protein, partial [Tanacetum coccineum]